MYPTTSGSVHGVPGIGACAHDRRLTPHPTCHNFVNSKSARTAWHGDMLPSYPRHKARAPPPRSVLILFATSDARSQLYGPYQGRQAQRSVVLHLNALLGRSDRLTSTSRVFAVSPPLCTFGGSLLHRSTGEGLRPRTSGTSAKSMELSRLQFAASCRHALSSAGAPTGLGKGGSLRPYRMQARIFERDMGRQEWCRDHCRWTKPYLSQDGGTSDSVCAPLFCGSMVTLTISSRSCASILNFALNF